MNLKIIKNKKHLSYIHKLKQWLYLQNLKKKVQSFYVVLHFFLTHFSLDVLIFIQSNCIDIFENLLFFKLNLNYVNA